MLSLIRRSWFLLRLRYTTRKRRIERHRFYAKLDAKLKVHKEELRQRGFGGIVPHEEHERYGGAANERNISV